MHAHMYACVYYPIPQPDRHAHPGRAHGMPPPFNRHVRTEKITYLFVSLAEGTLLERLADILAPAGEEPGVAFGVVHEDDFAR